MKLVFWNKGRRDYQGVMLRSLSMKWSGSVLCCFVVNWLVGGSLGAFPSQLLVHPIAVVSQSGICADVEAPSNSRIAACTRLIGQATSDGDRSDLYNNRATAFDKKGNIGRALADYAKAIQFNEKNTAAYVNRGDLYFHRGEFDKAIKDFDMAIKLQPDFERAYMGRTLALLRSNHPRKALDSADEMVRNEPDSAIAIETRAYVLKNIGRRDEAVADYRRALTRSSDIPELQQEIERALRNLGAAP